MRNAARSVADGGAAGRVEEAVEAEGSLTGVLEAVRLAAGQVEAGAGGGQGERASKARNAPRSATDPASAATVDAADQPALVPWVSP